MYKVYRIEKHRESRESPAGWIESTYEDLEEAHKVFLSLTDEYSEAEKDYRYNLNSYTYESREAYREGKRWLDYGCIQSYGFREYKRELEALFLILTDAEIIEEYATASGIRWQLAQEEMEARKLFKTEKPYFS